MTSGGAGQRTAFDLLDQLRNEISSLTRERNLYKLQRDDFSQKCMCNFYSFQRPSRVLGYVRLCCIVFCVPFSNAFRVCFRLTPRCTVERRAQTEYFFFFFFHVFFFFFFFFFFTFFFFLSSLCVGFGMTTVQRQMGEMEAMKQAMAQIERTQQMLLKRSGGIPVQKLPSGVGNQNVQNPNVANFNGALNAPTNIVPVNVAPNGNGPAPPTFPRLPQHQQRPNGPLASQPAASQQQQQQQQQQMLQHQQHQQHQQQQQQQQLQKPPVNAATTAAIAAAAAGDWSAQYDESNGTGRALEIDLAQTLQHESVVCAVAFSDDGRLLATGCNRSIRLFDTSTYENVQTVPMQHISAGSTAESAAAAATAAAAAATAPGDVYVRAVGFSPDSRYVAGGAENNAVGVWDVEEQRIVATLTGHDVDIYAVQWSADGKFIVTGSGDKTAKMWDWTTQSCVRTFGGTAPDGPHDGVTSVAVSPDSSVVAVASLDRTIRLWDVATGALKSRMEGHDDSVYSIAFSPDGKTLASGSLDKTLRLWDVANESCRMTLKGHRDYVLSVAFLPPHTGSEWLVSGSKDRTVSFWDVRLSSALAVLYGHKNSVISVAVHPKRTLIASGSGDCRARLWPYSVAH
jgi:WD40 repeat protein